MYGAMGVALGIVISEVLVLIFVFVIYQEAHPEEESRK